AFDDVRRSGFLQHEFAAIDSVPSNEDRAPMAGFRLFGKYNYLVLAGPDRGAGWEPGDVSITLGEEHADDFAALKSRTGMTLVESVAGGRSACSDGIARYCDGMVRWLEVPHDSSDRTRFRIALYGADRAAALAETDSLPASDRRVARLLRPVFDPDKSLAYISGATLAIPARDIVAISAALRRGGVSLVAEGEGAIIDLGGITLRLIPAWTGPGVKRIDFALTRDVPANPVYRFGPRSRLRFGPGPVAVWDFNSP
ncbi:MAG: DUF5829 family protein, partial [Gemmatimonadales bacterium]